MNTYDCKTYPTQLDNALHLIHPVLKSNVIKEETDEYNTSNSKNQTLLYALKQSELKALRKTASGQIARLYQIANLLTHDHSSGYDATELKQFKHDILDATSILEDTLYAITNSFIDDPKPSKDEIAD